jgi:putative chitobiose transport system substrate-binding protein
MFKKSSVKKLVATAMALILFASLFAGCGKKTETASTTPTPTQQEQITIQFWTISLQPTFTDFFNGLIKTYEEKHPNVKVQWTDMPYDAIQNKLITAAAGNTAPDVVNLNTQMALVLAGKNALVDLNKEATDEQKSIYIKPLFESAKMGDSIYAFPWYAAPTVMIYNKALFDKAGLTSTPKTFDEMFEAAKVMKQKTGAYLYIPDEFNRVLYLNGIKILSDDKTKAAFNTPETLALLNKYKQAVKEGYIPKNGWGAWDTMLQQFSTGKLAIINSGAQSIKRIKDEAPNIYKTIDVTEPMVGTPGISLNPLMNLVVPEASKHHKEAIDFANYITNDENQLAFCKTVQIFPSTTKASQDPFFTADTKTVDTKAVAIAAKSNEKSADLSLGLAQDADIFTAINKIYEAAILGNTDPQKAINDAEKKVNDLLAKK